MILYLKFSFHNSILRAVGKKMNKMISFLLFEIKWKRKKVVNVKLNEELLFVSRKFIIDCKVLNCDKKLWNSRKIDYNNYTPVYSSLQIQN